MDRGGGGQRCTDAKLWRRRLAAYGSTGGLEESAQGGDLEERVERHVMIWARAGGRCGAMRRDGGGSGSGCSSSCCVPAPRVGSCEKHERAAGTFHKPNTVQRALLQELCGTNSKIFISRPSPS
jgi:hypothetical protein